MEMDRPENPLIALGNLIGNLILLNLITLLCCLPLITAGAAFSALYYASFGLITGKNNALKRFFKAFGRDFKQATPIWLLLVLFSAAAVSFWYFISSMSLINGWSIALLCLILFWIFSLACWGFPLLARFDNTFFHTIKNVILLSVMRLPVTLVLIVINCAVWTILLFRTDIFLRLLIVWTAGCFSVPAYFSSLLLKKPLALDQSATTENMENQ